MPRSVRRSHCITSNASIQCEPAHSRALSLVGTFADRNKTSSEDGKRHRQSASRIVGAILTVVEDTVGIFERSSIENAKTGFYRRPGPAPDFRFLAGLQAPRAALWRSSARGGYFCLL